jgi:hypothetical protein
MGFNIVRQRRIGWCDEKPIIQTKVFNGEGYTDLDGLWWSRGPQRKTVTLALSLCHPDDRVVIANASTLVVMKVLQEGHLNEVNLESERARMQKERFILESPFDFETKMASLEMLREQSR